MLRYTLLFTLLFLLACQNLPAPGSSAPPNLQKDLLGTWETTYLEIKVDTYHNTDSSYVWTVESADWKNKLRVLPYQSYFDANHRFNVEYRDLQGKLLKEEKGIWNAFGDTLLLIRPDVTLQYKVAFHDKQAYFSGLVDWDSDGVEDDAYFSIQQPKAKN
jgi:hypothetical protein